MATPVLNPSAYSVAEQQALLTAAKAAYLEKITGQVQSGGSAAQNYSMMLMTVEDLIRLINSLTLALGLDNTVNQVTPNFNPPSCIQNSYTFGA